jgi:hypothetical protein
MVTAEVFARYRVGDYFNDQRLPPETSDSKDMTVAGVVHHRRHYRMAQTRRTHRKSVRRAGEIPNPNHQIPSNQQSFNLQSRIGDASFF